MRESRKGAGRSAGICCVMASSCPRRIAAGPRWVLEKSPAGDRTPTCHEAIAMKRSMTVASRRGRSALVGRFLGLLADVFGDARRTARALTEVVELRAPHRATHHDLDALDPRGVHRKDALDPDSVGRLANGEHFAIGAARAADHRALEDLDALLVALDDADVHPDRVTGPECGDVLAQLLGLDAVDRGHGNVYP